MFHLVFSVYAALMDLINDFAKGGIVFAARDDKQGFGGSVKKSVLKL